MRRFLIAAAIATVAATGAQAQSRQGNFTGASDHETSGTVVVDGNALSLQDNFSFDGAPDPRLAFGSGDSVDRDTIFAELEENTGAQNYEVPSSIDTSDYSHVWLWCQQFDVPLGVAPLGSN